MAGTGPPGVSVEPLAAREEWLEAVAGWHRAAFGKYQVGAIATDFAARLRQRIAVGAIPTTLVASRPGAQGQEGVEPVGCASLIAADMDGVALTPWLASLFVAPAARKAGVAQALIARVLAEAGALGHPSVYLWCESPRLAAYYEGEHGFRVLEQRDYRGRSVTVLAKATPRKSAT